MKWNSWQHCLVIWSLVTGLGGCSTGDNFFPETVLGYRPQYVPLVQIEDIRGLAPQPLRNPGRVLVYNNMLLVNELFEGVHLYENSNPLNPIPLGFIRILGCVEIDIREDVLFADNYTDLVTIDLSDLSTVQVTSRTKNVFEPTAFPPATNAYFECPDETQGVVVGWELTQLNNPKCFRP
ncbi:MAG TPA: hypothetical protein DCE41_14230 [Cytophagales bacterium]|nr:hypothetical protein [Cytophagales bacterium]HAA23499.1 hypothetical protein [Cytophagales bacterium]HAP61165.1 hypothetical protein [Cytophagales bacterium]